MAEANEQLRAQRVNDNPQAGRQSASQANGTDTVTIGCKTPHGLILNLTEFGKPARVFVVKGNNSAQVIGGFGITHGVPRAFWEEWKEKNKSLALVTNGLVFAYGKRDAAESHANEHAKLPHGFEPMLDPSRPKPQVEKMVE